MTTIATDSDVRDLANTSRATGRSLVIITSSGTQYVMAPLADAMWKIVRIGCDGSRPTVHYGPAYRRNGELVIGPWTTTGLRDAFVVD